MLKDFCDKIHKNSFFKKKKIITNSLISPISLQIEQDCSDLGGKIDWIGDGSCDDINNNAMCTFQWIIGPGTGLPLWDGGDCCGSEAQLNYCTSCTCNGELEIHKFALKKYFILQF